MRIGATFRARAPSGQCEPDGCAKFAEERNQESGGGARQAEQQPQVWSMAKSEVLAQTGCSNSRPAL